MSSLTKLQAAESLADIASLLSVKTGMLSYQLYKKPKGSLYQKFEIPKRYGGSREILAPESDLKLIQHRLSELLQDCQAEINQKLGHKEDQEHQGIAHGFKRFHTIMTNARPHISRRHVFNADLQDFFGTINFGRVRGFFISNKNFKLNPKAATVLAQIACFENRLPQGSPCSPVISNLIAHPLDVALAKLASTAGATYSRYADDLTFSTNKPLFPPSIAVKEQEHSWIPAKAFEQIVKKNGFSFNDKKTRMQYKDSRQEVTGLTVNKKVNVAARYRHTVRAMVSALFRTGKFEFIYRTRDAASAITFEDRTDGKRQQLLGMLSYIDQVDLFNRKLQEQNGLDPLPTPGRVAMFRRFLYFDAFFAPNEPVIVCEGKTDNIYLRCAIKSLAASYPLLAFATKPPKLVVRLFKYGDRRTSEISELTGGVGGICKLLKHYHEDLNGYFKAPTSKYPVIVLIDNDAGADSVYEAIAGITKKPKPKGKADFIHVTGNLYVVPTPLGPGGTKTAIEDLFPAATLAEQVSGKTFSREKKFDQTKHFGKAVFAKEVVAKQADSIDFDGFRKLLDRVVKVIENHTAKFP